MDPLCSIKTLLNVTCNIVTRAKMNCFETRLVECMFYGTLSQHARSARCTPFYIPVYGRVALRPIIQHLASGAPVCQRKTQNERQAQRKVNILWVRKRPKRSRGGRWESWPLTLNDDYRCLSRQNNRMLSPLPWGAVMRRYVSLIVRGRSQGWEIYHMTL